ncbi:unnamed protein product, partial [Urochloa humidicola]
DSPCFLALLLVGVGGIFISTIHAHGSSRWARRAAADGRGGQHCPPVLCGDVSLRWGMLPGACAPGAHEGSTHRHLLPLLFSLDAFSLLLSISSLLSPVATSSPGRNPNPADRRRRLFFLLCLRRARRHRRSSPAAYPSQPGLLRRPPPDSGAAAPPPDRRRP